MTTETQERGLAKTRDPLQEMLAQVDVRKRFEQILGKKAPAFISSIVSASQTNPYLAKCEPGSVVAAAAIAASLDLPINQSLGQAAIVPYKDKAQFQVMWKGYVQLGHRTGKYRRIHLAPVFEGQLVRHDEFEGVVELDAKLKKSDRVAGFYFFFELLNGYRHVAYWSAQACVDHGWKFSKSFNQYGTGQWVDDPLMPRKNEKPDIKAFKGLITHKSGLYAMCAKTVVKNELSKWGPMSTEMEKAVTFDQAAVDSSGKPVYIDTTAEPTATPAEATPPKRASEAGKADAGPKAQAPQGGGQEAVAKRLSPKKVQKVEGGGYRVIDGDGQKYRTDHKEVAELAAEAARKETELDVRYLPGAGKDEEHEILTAAPAKS